MQVVRALQLRLENALAEVGHQRVELQQVRDARAEEQRLLREHYDRVLKDRDQQLTEYAQLTAQLQDDLRQASRYVQQRQEHALELKQLQDLLEEKVQEQEKQLQAMRFQTMDRKMKLFAMEKTMRAQFDAMVKEESERMLQSQHRELLAHTLALEEEKVGLGQDVDDLVQFAQSMETDRTALRRQAELHRRAHEEVLRHAAVQNKQGRDTELKMQKLEATVRELQAGQDSIHATVAAEYEGQLHDLRQQLKASQVALQEHRAQLKQTRQLASQIVEQRTDLERFFLVAIEDCRKYSASLKGSVRAPGLPASAGSSLKASRPGQTSPPPPSACGLPPVRPPGQAAGRLAEPAGDLSVSGNGASFGELSWEAKEKVIKSLLFYINSTYYRNSPGVADGDA
ncbi:hypothetical protein STCU_02946 [Strigomonas culicis]|uniref:Uncharacterized protein n=1 Tax=Strigomonas culicis TaxID=28005 RepID=S9W8L3_9TRYP|nr:hypothetical protein STCU_02946 [Strigomonas culicis]|eukprot:EPY32160.1 hypothetical protein STCU_02946 [Strigomonas culicis]